MAPSTSEPRPSSDEPAPAPSRSPSRTRSRTRRAAYAVVAAALVVALAAGLVLAFDPGPGDPTGKATGKTTGKAGRLAAGQQSGAPLAPATPDGPVPTAPAQRTPAAPVSERPNVLVIMADDMRVDDLRFAPRTRRLLARQGLTFENSFSPFPLCCPARASFLTGQYAHNHQVLSHEKPYGYGSFDDSATLATAFRDAGYRTGMIGKYLNRYGLDPSLVSGRDSTTYVPDGWDDWHATLDGGGGRTGGTYNYFNTRYNRDGRVDEGHRGEYQTRTVGRFSRELLDDYRGDDKPFFLYVNYLAPHHGTGRQEDDDPRGVRDSTGRPVKVHTPSVPSSVRGRFDRLVRRPAGIPRTGGNGEADVSDKPEFVRDRPLLSRSVKRAVTELTRQRAESISVMDREIAATIGRLRRNGQWRNTMVVFTSDNGYALGEQRLPFGKLHVHEPILRVPLLVSAPGARTGESRYDPISTVDLTATLLDAADAVPPREPDGRSLLPTVLGGDTGWDIPVVVESSKGRRLRGHGFTGRANDPRTAVGLRTPRYTLVRYRTGETELYDLERDPQQLRSVHRDPAYAEVLARLTDLWSHYVSCTGQACLKPLPPDLRASVRENAARTDAYWAELERVFAFR